MAEVTTQLKAKEAVEAGFRHFKELFSDATDSRVLLEGLEFLREENQWRVTIGFDSSRKVLQHGKVPHIFAQLGMGDNKSAPVREFRHFFLNANDGSLVKLGQK
jgi:hypothetical protein